MTEFETALQECLGDLEEGAASLDDCLKRYPEHAAQLGSLLRAGAYLERAAEVPIPAELKARVRARVMEGVYAHPRRPARSGLTFMKLSASLIAAVLTLLASGTAYAQRALPGNAFYTWKLASERAWRTVSADPLETDLRITVRRADELIAVSQDPAVCPQALKNYLETTDRLKSEMNVQNEARIRPLLDAQRQRLGQSGIHVPQAGQGIVPAEQPAQVSTAAPLPALSTVRPVATDAPQVLVFPTAKAPQILPTRKAPPRVVPKIEVPPPIH